MASAARCEYRHLDTLVDLCKHEYITICLYMRVTWGGSDAPQASDGAPRGHREAVGRQNTRKICNWSLSRLVTHKCTGIAFDAQD